MLCICEANSLTTIPQCRGSAYTIYEFFTHTFEIPCSLPDYDCTLIQSNEFGILHTHAPNSGGVFSFVIKVKQKGSLFICRQRLCN